MYYFGVYDQFELAQEAIREKLQTLKWELTLLYRYVMPLGVASLTDTITGSRENGTIFYTPT